MGMRYNSFLFNLLAGRIKRGLVAFYPEERVERWRVEARPIYKGLLSEVEGIDERNPMASNILTSFVIVAMWLASDREVTPHQMAEAMRTAMDMPVLRLAYGAFDLNTGRGVRGVRSMLERSAAYAEAHPEETAAWDLTFDDGLHADGVSYHFTRCPIADFCRAHGYEEINPVLCDIDYDTCRMMHGELRREHTLAAGGALCDYWMVGDRVEDPR